MPGGDAACPDEAVAARCAPRLGVLTTTGLWTAAVEMSGAVEGVSANGGLAAASDEVPSVPWPEVSSGVVRVRGGCLGFVGTVRR